MSWGGPVGPENYSPAPVGPVNVTPEPYSFGTGQTPLATIPGTSVPWEALIALPGAPAAASEPEAPSSAETSLQQREASEQSAADQYFQQIEQEAESEAAQQEAAAQQSAQSVAENYGNVLQGTLTANSAEITQEQQAPAEMAMANEYNEELQQIPAGRLPITMKPSDSPQSTG